MYYWCFTFRTAVLSYLIRDSLKNNASVQNWSKDILEYQGFGATFKLKVYTSWQKNCVLIEPTKENNSKKYQGVNIASGIMNISPFLR